MLWQLGMPFPRQRTIRVRGELGKYRRQMMVRGDVTHLSFAFFIIINSEAALSKQLFYSIQNACIDRFQPIT